MEQTVEAGAGTVRTSRLSLILISVLVVVVLALIASGVWWWMMRPQAQPVPFFAIENGARVWYSINLEYGKVEKSEAPEYFLGAPQGVLLPSEFSDVRAENGTTVALSPQGLVAINEAGERTVLIDRTDIDYGSASIAPDATGAALYNSATNQIDFFSLDQVRPAVLSYEGSIDAPETLYGVSVPTRHVVVVRSSEDTFTAYYLSQGTATKMVDAKLASGIDAFFSSLTPRAHAWTYLTAPTATGATTASNMRCTGAQVATLGTASGTGTMPSAQTTVWSYMPSPQNLPASYNNGSYCVQALVTVTTSGGDDGGGGGRDTGGGGEQMNDVFENDPYDTLSRLFVERAKAQSTSWTIAYTVHSGAGTSAGANYYALTYASAASATLTATPNPVAQNSAIALSWSSTNAASCTGTNFSTGNQTSGTVYVTPTGNTTYTVTCGTASDSETVTVSSLPNLTAGGVTPLSALPQTQVTLYSTVTNSGSSTTGAGFATLFQRATSAGGAGATDIGVHVQGTSVASGASISAGLAHTFPSEGTWYVRACADKSNATNTGAITESNEGDNCSGWTAITVSSSTGTGVWMVGDVYVHNYQCGAVNQPQSSGNSFCTNNQPPSGSCAAGSTCQTSTYGIYPPPDVCTNYSLYDEIQVYECSASASQCTPTVAYHYWYTGGTQVDVVIERANNALNCDSLPAAGAYTHWNRQVLDYNQGTGPDVYDPIETTCSYYNNPTGTTQKQPYSNTTGYYYFDSGTSSCAATGDVTASLSAVPDTIDKGESTTLTWGSSGASVCYGSGFSTAGELLGDLLVSPEETTTYILSCLTETTSSGVWTLAWTDTSDVSCPATNASRVYSAFPDCTAPAGSACTNSGHCKINSPTAACTIETEVYTCSGGTETDVNVPFVMEEWWVGGTSTLVWGEWVHNNDFSEQDRALGIGFEEMCAAQAGGYDAWNMEILDTERVGDAGTNLAWIKCYGVNDPTGTVAKPQETIITNHAWQATGGTEYKSYLRSESSSGSDTSGLAIVMTTVTVNTTQCSDGEDNDGDGDVDMADGGCDDGNDNDESGEVRADLTANPTQVSVGASSTLTWSCTGGATSASIAGIGAVSPASGGSVSTGALSQSTNNFELTCTKGAQTDTDIAVVTTRTPTGDIEARDERVLDGGSTLITWACDALSTSGSATAPNGFSQNTVSGTNAPSGTITTQTVFTLTCDGVVVDSEIVNTAVNVDEF